MTVVSPDRRVLLFRILSEVQPEPIGPEDAGSALLDRLLLPRVRDVYLEAARPWPEDTEDLVHDVRVATRRLAEALALVIPVIGKKRAARARRRAKNLRRALGKSREADVLVSDFRRLAEEAGLDEPTVHALDAMTERGQDALREAKDAYPPERLLQHGVDVLRLAALPKGTSPLRELAGRHLYARVEVAAPLVAHLSRPDRAAEHHELRVACKHIRYTLEILADPFGDVFDGKATIGRLKKLQDALGVLNDAQDLLDWLERPFLKRSLGEKLATEVRKHAQALRRRRYEEARDLVLEGAPLLFGELRRTAGLIGPIDV